MTKLITVTLLCLSLLSGCTTHIDNKITVASLENDSGFGGTGIISRLNDEEGSGFGGTGIVGNIHAFGSIWVNGIEVEYETDVILDSNLSIKSDRLKLGQQVILETNMKLTRDELPKTQKISIFYPIAGRIDAVKEQQIKVQDQWIHYTNSTNKDDGLNLIIGNYVIINATPVKDNQWTATRLNLNKKRLSQFQTKMVLNFSKNIQQVVIEPNLARMQWHLKSSLFSSQSKTMIIGRWNHKRHELISGSIHQRNMLKQSHSIMKNQNNMMNTIDQIRTFQNNSLERGGTRMMSPR